MTEYYVDPTATGTNDGSTTTNAWTSVQRAIDGTGGTQPAAGDTVLCKAGGGVDETLSAQIDVDGLQGSLTTGLIQCIGVNSSWVNDGTRYVISGNSVVVNCLDFNLTTPYYHLWINFECTLATEAAIAVDTLGGYRVYLINCSGTASSRGGTFRQNVDGLLLRCRFSGNTTDGIHRGARGIIAFCCLRDNGVDGLDTQYSTPNAVIGNLIFDNGAWGVKHQSASTIMALINNVIDNNASGGVDKVASATLFCMGNRITNHSGVGAIGLNCNSEGAVHGWNYFENNDGANIQNASLASEILDDGLSTNIEDQGDTNQGYKSTTEGAENYELDDDPEASGFSVGVSIPTGQ